MLQLSHIFNGCMQNNVTFWQIADWYTKPLYQSCSPKAFTDDKSVLFL